VAGAIGGCSRQVDGAMYVSDEKFQSRNANQIVAQQIALTTRGIVHWLEERHELI